ncbi:PTS sugar transporter subunit IIB [Agromyces larvae]|uniref:PTS IIB subunit n=1 Tax=Agromyces larvae TaxID=2929802 RepID=A0ABY4BTS7_9MICO|nr:PTS IIB subunit [Agromyces larvae]UOE42607.1 PTS IIB subunit [Agromyces larvae]
MRVIVVCGAGASSTFVALRVRRLAAERGLDVDARAASEALLAEAIADADVLLVGAHLAERLDELRRIADEASVALAMLPDGAAHDDGATALDLALTTHAGAGS